MYERKPSRVTRKDVDDVDRDDTRTDLRELITEIGPGLRRADRRLRRLVRRHPATSLALVTFAGVLLGRLLRR